MKNMKKIVCALMALVMVLTMGLSAFAANPGSITISKAVAGQEYRLFRLMNVAYDEALTAFTYTADPDWETFLNSAGIKGKYVDIDEHGIIEWHKNLTCTEEHTHIPACYTDANAADFAYLAKEYAKANGITPDATQTAASNIVNFTDLELGYYLIDSTLGILCSLDTTVPHQDMIEKNGLPTVDKKVRKPDGTLDTSASYEIGDMVEFVSKITIYNGSEKLVYHDIMEPGLTLDATSIEVRKNALDGTALVEGVDYNLVLNGVTGHNDHATLGCTDANCKLNASTECDFEIVFTADYLNDFTRSAEASQNIYIIYDAELNKDAEILDPDSDEESNDNDAKITFGENNCSQWIKAKVYTYQLDLVKVNELHKILSGAKFELYDVDPASDTDDTTPGVQPPNPLNLVKTSSAKDATYDFYRNTYRLPTTTDDPASYTTEIEVDFATLEGIRVNKTYWLVETAAPAGYNALQDPVVLVLTTDEIADGDYKIDLTEDKWHTGGLHIINSAGLMMPETGGMGTTLFYVVGGILFVGAAVVLITKKRMSSEN